MNKTRIASQLTTRCASSQVSNRLTTPNNLLDVAIEYHPGVEDGDIQLWASDVGVTVSELKRVTKSTVRNCHHASVLRWKQNTCRPDIYELGLGQLKVVYTVEPQGVVIRGYTPNIPDSQVTEEEAGRFFCDTSWGRETINCQAQSSASRHSISDEVKEDEC